MQQTSYLVALPELMDSLCCCLQAAAAGQAVHPGAPASAADWEGGTAGNPSPAAASIFPRPCRPSLAEAQASPPCSSRSAAVS